MVIELIGVVVFLGLFIAIVGTGWEYALDIVRDIRHWYMTVPLCMTDGVPEYWRIPPTMALGGQHVY